MAVVTGEQSLKSNGDGQFLTTFEDYSDLLYLDEQD